MSLHKTGAISEWNMMTVRQKPSGAELLLGRA